MSKAKRHGDVIFRPITSFAKTTKTTVKHNGSFIVAEGEATGHNHTIEVDDPDDLIIVQKDGKIFIELKDTGTVTHQEHKKITIPPGKYEVGIEQEQNPFTQEISRVVD